MCNFLLTFWLIDFKQLLLTTQLKRKHKINKIFQNILTATLNKTKQHIHIYNLKNKIKVNALVTSVQTIGRKTEKKTV